MLLAINLFMIPFFVWVLKVSQRVINPIVLVLCVLGVFAVRGEMIDVAIMVVCGVVGYVLRKNDYPIAPLILSIVLSSLAEKSLRQSLIMGKGSVDLFFTRPVCLALMIVMVLLLIWPLLMRLVSRAGARNAEQTGPRFAVGDSDD
jgi:putative tricarboxylic transport membrane protein